MLRQGEAESELDRDNFDIQDPISPIRKTKFENSFVKVKI
jgi:hypothetical protein